MPHVEVQELRRAFGEVEALRGIDVSLETGEFLSLLGAMILLFGNAFAAYATAYSLTSGTVNIVPILIGAYYSGNVLDNPHLAQALAFGMFVVLAVMMIVYVPLQRRAARWAK